MWPMKGAIFGKFSLIWMPGTLVAMGLKGPPLACPGLRSNVSSWDGPPLIHRRMQERLRWVFLAASRARTSSQPDIEVPKPAALRRSQSRRDRDEMRFMNESSQAPRPRPAGLQRGLMIQHELRAVEQHPEHVGECLFRVALLDIPD